MRLRAQIIGIAVSTMLSAPALPNPPEAGNDDPAQGAVWDLSPLFPDAAAWEKERAQIDAALPELSRIKGTLGSSAAALHKGLESISAIRQRLERLAEYADLNADADARRGGKQTRVQQSSIMQTPL